MLLCYHSGNGSMRMDLGFLRYATNAALRAIA